jgi:hypothetical protein
MGVAEHAGHALLILCTFGFWYPVYRSRRSRLEHTTRFYD